MYRHKDRIIIAKYCAKFYLTSKKLYLNISNNYFNQYNIINYLMPFIIGYFIGHLLLSK